MENTLIKKQLCIRCPRGCEITAEVSKDTVTVLQQGFCKLGNECALEELLSPKRVITTTVTVAGGIMPLVPVWTTSALPLHLVQPLLKTLRSLQLAAPIPIGFKVIRNFMDSGVDIETSSAVEAAG